MTKLLLTWLAALVLAGCSGRGPAFRGTVIDPPLPAADFTLTDQRGQPFRLSEQRDRLVLLFFGYTYCPDVCPATLAVWNQVHKALGKDAGRVRFVFITVDPERDTPQRIGEHLALFNPDFVGLTGSQEELDAVYKAYGIFREKDTTSGSAAGYLVSHTASFQVVDGQGQRPLDYSFGTEAEDIVHDLRQLLK